MSVLSEPTTTTGVEPRGRNLWRTAFIALVAVLVLAGGGYIAHHQYTKAHTANVYSDWPASGSNTSNTFSADVIVALTCRDGRAHLDHKVLVDPTDPRYDDMAVYWYVRLLIAYDQSINIPDCQAFWFRYDHPNGPKTIAVASLVHRQGESGWRQVFADRQYLGDIDFLRARKGTTDIAVLLIDVLDDDLPPGPVVMSDSSGELAPSLDLLS